MTSTIELPPIARYQRDAIFCEEKMAIIEATTKAGKTVGCILWLIQEAFNGGGAGREFWWVAPVYTQTEIAYRRTCATMRSADPEMNLWKKNDSDLFITFDNGSVMRFKTAEKPDNLYGEDVYAAVIDEASRCRKESYYAVRTTLTATNGKMRIIGNVKGKKNWAYELARKVQQGLMPGWHYAKIRAADAVKEGIITQTAVDEAKRELPEAVFKELYEAEPSEDGSNPFGLGHIAACVQQSLSTSQPQVFGIDLAKSVDWTVVVGLDAARNVCFFERWQRESWERTTARILEIVGQTPALADSTGVGDPIVETLQRSSPNIEGMKFTNASKQQMMEGLALSIQKHEVGFPAGQIKDELEWFEYEILDQGRVRYSAPEGIHDDCVCALALAVERARRYVPVTAGIIGRKTSVIVPLLPELKESKCACGAAYRTNDPLQRWCSVRCEMDEKRKDPNYGF